MLPFKLIYHPHYELNLGEHVFRSRKYRLIHDRLLSVLDPDQQVQQTIRFFFETFHRKALLAVG